MRHTSITLRPYCVAQSSAVKVFSLCSLESNVQTLIRLPSGCRPGICKALLLAIYHSHHSVAQGGRTSSTLSYRIPLHARCMDRNQSWPGEPPSQLAATSTHELFGASSAPGQQLQQQILHHQQQDPSASYGHQFASEVGVKKPARRNRNALSCAECRRLKLKCSRIWPCTVSLAITHIS